ncbi:hypothetical protein L9F63_009625, partial [Diploptera punctata]
QPTVLKLRITPVVTYRIDPNMFWSTLVPISSLNDFSILSLPQTPQSGKSFSALLNGGAPGEHSSSIESVPESGTDPDH